MGAQAGRLRAKMAAVGWKEGGSSSVAAEIVNDLSLPTTPPTTKLPHTGQELRTASPPFAAFVVYCSVRPLKRTALLAKPMNGINAEPDAFWQLVQEQRPA